MTGTPPETPKTGGDKKVAGDKKGKGQSSGGTEDGGAVVQRVVREVSGGISYPVLTKTNYSTWARLMKVKLKARGLWRAIEDGDVDTQEDMLALDALCTAVPPEMADAIADSDTAKKAWDTIATMRVGDDRVRKNAAQQLQRDFELAAFMDGESVEDFALRMQGMQATLQTLG
ncbi:unnamed protein product [Urochloa humidicola]